MAEQAIRLPDVGEGVAEAELVEWHVKIGDLVREDDVLAAVMTDKATVEIPSPIAGEIVWVAAEVGSVIAVGADLVRLKVAGSAQGAGAAKSAVREPAPAIQGPPGDPVAEIPASPAARKLTQDASARAVRLRQGLGGAPRREGEKPLASPAVRLRALDAGVDLRQVPGTGPAGRITHEDLDAVFARGLETPSAPGLQPRTGVKDLKIVGLRRRIAEKMSIANARIPHITYVEEVDVTALEALRTTLNGDQATPRPRLTLLPFLMRALARAVAEHPKVNSLFDDEVGVLHQHEGVHVGIAAQTDAGLLVPVVRHVEALDLWGCATALNQVAEAAKQGTVTRDALRGSTITITSLGAMGGVVTTPIINHPEVAIVGVNKMVMRPVWDGLRFAPRKMMNLSSSFDHRVVDGFDAAVFVQRIKALLETPALIFMES